MKKGMSDGKRTFLYGILFGCVYSTHMGIKMLLEGISSVSLRLTAPSAEVTKVRSPSVGFAIALWKPSPVRSSNYIAAQR